MNEIEVNEQAGRLIQQEIEEAGAENIIQAKPRSTGIVSMKAGRSKDASLKPKLMKHMLRDMT